MIALALFVIDISQLVGCLFEQCRLSLYIPGLGDRVSTYEIFCIYFADFYRNR